MKTFQEIIELEKGSIIDSMQGTIVHVADPKDDALQKIVQRVVVSQGDIEIMVTIEDPVRSGGVIAKDRVGTTERFWSGDKGGGLKGLKRGASSPSTRRPGKMSHYVTLTFPGNWGANPAQAPTRKFEPSTDMPTEPCEVYADSGATQVVVPETDEQTAAIFTEALRKVAEQEPVVARYAKVNQNIPTDILAISDSHLHFLLAAHETATRFTDQTKRTVSDENVFNMASAIRSQYMQSKKV